MWKDKFTTKTVAPHVLTIFFAYTLFRFTNGNITMDYFWTILPFMATVMTIAIITDSAVFRYGKIKKKLLTKEKEFINWFQRERLGNFSPIAHLENNDILLSIQPDKKCFYGQELLLLLNTIKN